MAEMELVPYERLGPVRLGASEEEIVAELGQPANIVPRRTGSRDLYYHDLGVRAKIKVEGRCTFIGAFSGLSDRWVPVVNGQLRLLGEVEEIVAALHARGYTTRPGPDDSEVTRDVLCDELGIRLWHESEDVVGVEEIGVFDRESYQIIRNRRD